MFLIFRKSINRKKSKNKTNKHSIPNRTIGTMHEEIIYKKQTNKQKAIW